MHSLWRWALTQVFYASSDHFDYVDVGDDGDDDDGDDVMMIVHTAI